MHDLHFACDCDGFEEGWMICMVFSMLGSIFTTNQRNCDHPGFNIRGGLISGNWVVVCTTSCKSNTYNFDRN